MAPPVRTLGLIVVVLAGAALVAHGVEHQDQEHQEEPEMPSLLSGYDLPSIVQAIMAEVDGCEPAPLVVTTTGSVPATLELTPDKRARAAVVVGLTLTGLDALTWRVAPTVQGIELAEGVLPVDAVDGSSGASEDGLLAPIVLPGQAPLRLAITALPGESPAADTATATAQLLYGSDAAAAAVARAFGGQGGWYSLYAQRGSASRTVPLTVQRAGVPRYLRSDQSGGATLALTLDGRELAVPAVTVGALPSGAALPHSVEGGQIYNGVFALTDAVAGRAFWAWHGVRDALP